MPRVIQTLTIDIPDYYEMDDETKSLIASGAETEDHHWIDKVGRFVAVEVDRAESELRDRLPDGFSVRFHDEVLHD